MVFRYDFGEGRVFGVEILLVQPYLRRCAVVAAGLGIIREQAWQFLRGVSPLREGGIDLSRIEWRLPAHHAYDRDGVFVIRFHQVLARGHGILLRNHTRRAECDGCNCRNRKYRSKFQEFLPWFGFIRSPANTLSTGLFRYPRAGLTPCPVTKL